MSEEDVYLETDDAEEWMYYTVMGYDSLVGAIGAMFRRLAGVGPSEHVVNTVEKALDAVPVEADEAIENDLSMLKENYKEGEMGKEKHEYSCSDAEKNREPARNELIDINMVIKFKDGYAASELLAALLGNPGTVYEGVVEPQDDAAINATKIEFERKVREIGQDHECRLRKLVPRALEVMKILKKDETMMVMGMSIDKKDDEVRAWLDAYSRLERNLISSQ